MVGHTQGDPKLNVSYHKERQYGWGSVLFLRNQTLSELEGGWGGGHTPWGMDLMVSEMGWGIPPGDPLSASLNASYHNEQYTWFRGGGSQVFEILNLINWRGGAYPHSQCH